MKKVIPAAMFIFWLVLAPMPAYAYLDPGAGSALLQGILGAVAAIGVALKLYWHRVLKFLGLRKPKDGVDSVGRNDEQKTENHP